MKVFNNIQPTALLVQMTSNEMGMEVKNVISMGSETDIILPITRSV